MLKSNPPEIKQQVVQNDQSFSMPQHQSNASSKMYPGMIVRTNIEPQLQQNTQYHKSVSHTNLASLKNERSISREQQMAMIASSTDNISRYNQKIMEKSSHSQATYDHMKVSSKVEATSFSGHENITSNPQNYSRFDSSQMIPVSASNHNYSFRADQVNTNNDMNGLINFSRLRKKFDFKNFNPECFKLLEGS